MQIIVTIIINYYYIIYFARANVVSKVYRYSRAQINAPSKGIFCNVLSRSVCIIAYVCPICEYKLRGCWWSFSWLGQSNMTVWHPHCVCDCQFQRIHWTTVSILVDSKDKKDRSLILSFPVLLLDPTTI